MMHSSSNQNDHLPAATWEMLEKRAELLARVRAFFNDKKFLEVETPILSQDVVIDRHLDPFVTNWYADARLAMMPLRTCQAREKRMRFDYWLQTSPEFGMKRLLAAPNARSIFQIAKVFRNGELGTWHNPEFTMIEWYRPGDDYNAGMQLLSDFAAAMLNRGPAKRVSYRELFQTRFNVNPHLATALELATISVENQIAAPSSLGPDRDAWLDFLLTETLQDQLGRNEPVILFDYPATQSALAQLRTEKDEKSGVEYQVAERFELFVDGVELANGYHELLDAAVLHARNQINNLARDEDGREMLPTDSRLIKAMEQGLPPCAGCALGFDRLLMVLTGAKEISEVLAFPWERA